MPSFQFIEKLLETPLFQGLSKADLHEIVGRTKFGFSKYDADRIVVRADGYCSELLFLLNGTIDISVDSADHAFTVTERLSAPLQIQPHRLFGLNQHYTATVRTFTPCNFMTLSKSEVMKLHANYDIFRINLTNLLATSVQRYENRLFATPGDSLRARIVRFFTMHSTHPAGEKIIKIKMNTLAHELNDSRLNVSIELNKLQSEGLIALSRGLIRIPALERCLLAL